MVAEHTPLTNAALAEVADERYESDVHSIIAAEMGFLLRTIFSDNTQYILFNSNRPVYIESCGSTGTGRSAGAVFNADGMVVSVPRQPVEYQKGMSAETNPVLLVEILSPSTRAYDFGTKLPCYKQILSLQTILFIEQDKPRLTVMERRAPNQWIDTTYQNLSDTFIVAGMALTLQQVYRGIFD